MTYGRWLRGESCGTRFADAGVSHSAELVRGDFRPVGEGPLIRPFGPPSPQGEKGHCGLSTEFHCAPPDPAWPCASVTSPKVIVAFFGMNPFVGAVAVEVNAVLSWTTSGGSVEVVAVFG